MAAAPLLVMFLPGLDGTGRLFAPLLAELPGAFEPKVVQYPPDRALGYEALASLVEAQLPAGRKFALVGESFSGPLAVSIAAKTPQGLVAVVLAASFHRCPVSPWLAAVRPVARAIFARPAPVFVLRHLLAGPDAPAALVEEFRAAVAMVRPEVLSARVRAALDVDASDALSACRVPILYLGGTEDRLLRRAIPEEIRAIRPNVDVRFLASPHLILQRRPREAAAALSDFLVQAGRTVSSGSAAQ
jgi:pimeloyl-ACP methyl ester carboxylesterase